MIERMLRTFPQWRGTPADVIEYANATRGVSVRGLMEICDHIKSTSRDEENDRWPPAANQVVRRGMTLKYLTETTGYNPQLTPEERAQHRAHGMVDRIAQFQRRVWPIGSSPLAIGEKLRLGSNDRAGKLVEGLVGKLSASGDGDRSDEDES